MKKILSILIMNLSVIGPAFSMGSGSPLKCLSTKSSSQVRSFFNQYVRGGAPGKSKAGVVYIVNSNGGIEATLLSHNAHSPQAVASTQKIMTAYTLINNYGRLSSKAYFSSNDLVFDNLGARARYPSGNLINVGDEPSFNNLLRTLLVQSSNGAANAIAREAGGTINKFMIELNHNVNQLLGSNNSFFQNPSGLTDNSSAYRYMDSSTWQRSTAHDMARFLAKIMSKSKIRSAIASSGISSARSGTLQKFGFTQAAGKTYVTISKMKGSCSQYSLVGAFFGQNTGSQFQNFVTMWGKIKQAAQ